jgi:DNA-binding NtrC family response regulator
VRAVKTGARNFLTKPIDLEQLVAEIRDACDALSAAASGTHTAVPRHGRSATMAALYDEVTRLKDARCSILILGETGTGKTMLARWLHDESQRRASPFVDLNCAGLAPDLVESELFGHERGAFTSAHAAKPGVFELADGGTLFLDEIGDIAPAVQPKVLKAIEEKRFRRMGSLKERSVDVRVIAATHRDLHAAVRQGTFRADLYYRLSTVRLTVPALRERRSEIPILARELLASLALKLDRDAPVLTLEAEERLMGYPWPGNVRELKNVLERALHFVGPACSEVQASDLALDASGIVELAPRSSTLQELEREQIERAVASHGRVSEAARSLGISRSSLYLKLKAYGIQPSRGYAPRTKVADGSRP